MPRILGGSSSAYKTRTEVAEMTILCGLPNVEEEEAKADEVDEKGKPKNNKHIFKFMKKFNKYFDSEWSFAKFRVTDSRTICAFTKDENLVVISSDGTYYLARLDTKNGGECKKIEEKKCV